MGIAKSEAKFSALNSKKLNLLSFCKVGKQTKVIQYFSNCLQPSRLKDIVCQKIDPITLKNFSGVQKISFFVENIDQGALTQTCPGKISLIDIKVIVYIKLNRKTAALARLNQLEDT